MTEKTTDLAAIRTDIDSLDAQLIALLKRRSDLVAQAFEARGGHHLRDAKREQELIASRQEWANENGLSPQFCKHIFELILHDMVLQHQHSIAS